MEHKTADVAVIGGGVIGLACAWRLAQHSVRVVLLERGAVGFEATHAAGGMLAPQCEALVHAPRVGAERARKLFEFGCQSRDLYPAFADELWDASGGVDVELCLKNATRGDWREAGIRLVTQNGERFLEDEGQVEPRRLAVALTTACRKIGVQIRENEPVERTELCGDRIIALHTSRATIHPQSVLLCAGAWSRTIGGLPPEVLPEVRPLAGQMVQLRGEQLVRHVVYSPSCYLIPRRDGRLLIGATVEEVGFNKNVTASGIFELLKCALQLAPQLNGAWFEGAWAGLRPATPDGVPVLGPTPIENLFTATGHGRNGVLLAPRTAQVVADALLGAGTWPSFAILH